MQVSIAPEACVSRFHAGLSGNFFFVGDAYDH